MWRRGVCLYPHYPLARPLDACPHTSSPMSTCTCAWAIPQWLWFYFLLLGGELGKVGDAGGLFLPGVLSTCSLPAEDMRYSF